MKHKRAFTLIELLVVITVIALLVSLILSALSRAKTITRQTQCMANVRTQAQAFVAYANDYDGVLPTARDDVGDSPYGISEELARKLATYGLYDGSEEGMNDYGPFVNNPATTAWRCAEATHNGRFLRLHHPTGPWFRIDHFMIMTDLQDHPNFFGNRSPSRLEDPVAPMTADQTVAWVNVDPTWTGNHPSRAGTSNAINNIGAQLDPGGMNQSYNDGHAEWKSMVPRIPLDDMKYLVGSARWYWIEDED